MNEIRIIIEGLNELTEAVRRLAGHNGIQDAGMALSSYGQAPETTFGAAAGQAVQPQQTAPVQQNMQFQSAAVQQGNPQQGMALQQSSPGGRVPVTAAPQQYTIEQLQVAAAGLTSSGKMPQVMGILQNFGIQAMTELPQEQYGAFAAALRGAGAQI